MKKQEHLFHLIQSLSPSEKRYFRIFSGIHGKEEKSYLLLFDEVAKLASYDEKVLKQKLIKHNFTNNFHVIKKELFDLILKSLTNYHVVNYAKIEILQLFHQIHLLNEKGLSEIAIPLIDKSIEIAKKHEHTALLAEAYSLYTTTTLSNKIIKLSLEEIDKNFADKNAVLKLLSEEFDVEETLKRFQHQFVHKKKISKDTIHINENEAVLAIIKTATPSTTSFNKKINFYLIKFLYSYSIGDLKSSARSVESLIRIFETNEFLLKENQFKYVQSVYNYAVVKLALKKYADVEKAVEKFTAIDSKETRIHRSIFTMKFILLSAVYIARKEFNKVVNMEEDILKGLKIFRNKINTKDFQALHFNLASSYFSIENYGKCISHLNAFLNEQKENLNKDIFTISELLFVLAHYELGNLELIRSLIKQAKKNFEAYHADWEIEKLVFDFLLNTNYTNKKELLAKQFNVLKYNVTKSLKTKAGNYKDSNYNYILDWIDKKHQKNKLF